MGPSMAFFHIRKSKIVLECVTPSAAVAKYAAIARSGKFLPEWWVDLAKNTTQNPKEYSRDMRDCVGMLDSFSNGVSIPLWSELKVIVGARGQGGYQFQFADQKSFAESHAESQRGAYLPDAEYQHLKIAVPWFIECAEAVDFYCAQPTWNMTNLSDYTVLPGVVNFKYQHTANINLMFPRGDVTKEILLPLGQPMMQLMPLDNRPIEIKIIVDAERYTKLHDLTLPLTFSDGYRRKKAIIKTQESRCPFGFSR